MQCPNSALARFGVRRVKAHFELNLSLKPIRLKFIENIEY